MSSADRSISAVLADIVGDVQAIVRAEVRLAKAEVHADIVRARRLAILATSGAIAGLFALAFLEVAVLYALSRVLPAWGAALVLAIVNGVAGMMLAGAAKRQAQQVRGTPERTVATIEENMQWAKARTK
jgi:hypothetical protein